MALLIKIGVVWFIIGIFVSLLCGMMISVGSEEERMEK